MEQNPYQPPETPGYTVTPRQRRRWPYVAICGSCGAAFGYLLQWHDSVWDGTVIILQGAVVGCLVGSLLDWLDPPKKHVPKK